MLRLYIPLCLILPFLCSCLSVPETKNPAQLRRRADTLLTKVSSLRKKREGCKLLLTQTEDQIDRQRVKLRSLRQQKANFEKRIEELKEKQARDNEDMSITINRYKRRIESVEAQIHSERSMILTLRTKIDHHTHLLKRYNRRIHNNRQEARKLRQLAERFTENPDS